MKRMKTLILAVTVGLAACSNGGGGNTSADNGPSQGPDPAVMNALKRQVITQVAVEHNFSPDDVIQYDAQVDPVPGAAGSYHLTGTFVVETDKPSTVYEAANQIVARNICAVEPSRCATKKIQHTVRFDATATNFQKLDGTPGLRITEQATVDRPAPSQVAASAPPVAPVPEPQRVAAPPVPVSAPAASALPDQDVALTSSAPPRFPPSAVRQHHQGTVWLLVQVQPSGEAGDVRVDQSSGYRELDQAAIEAARRWHFRPRVRHGAPETANVRLPVNFGLNGANGASGMQARAEPAAPHGGSEAASSPSSESTPGPFHPSFDCTRASTPTELAICGDQGLSLMDVNVANEYHALVSRASPDQATALKESQRAWIKTRAQCGSDKECIQQQLANRIPELRAVSH